MMEKALIVAVVVMGLAILKMVRDAGLLIYSWVVLVSQVGGWILIVYGFRTPGLALLSGGLALLCVAIYLMHRPAPASKGPVQGTKKRP